MLSIALRAIRTAGAGETCGRPGVIKYAMVCRDWPSAHQSGSHDSDERGPQVRGEPRPFTACHPAWPEQIDGRGLARTTPTQGVPPHRWHKKWRESSRHRALCSRQWNCNPYCMPALCNAMRVLWRKVT